MGAGAGPVTGPGGRGGGTRLLCKSKMDESSSCRAELLEKDLPTGPQAGSQMVIAVSAVAIFKFFMKLPMPFVLHGL